MNKSNNHINQKYLKKILNTSKLSEKTKDVYIGNLSLLNDKELITNLNFLKDNKTIYDKLKNKSKITQRNYIISICAVLNLTKKNKELVVAYNNYKKKLFELNKEIKLSSNELTTRVKDNWLSKDEINEQVGKYKKLYSRLNRKQSINSNEWDELVNGLVLFLYTLTLPRRTHDYQNIVLSNSNNSESNILNVSDNEFIFKDYKTKKLYGTQNVKIPKELLKYISIYIKFHPLNNPLNKAPINLFVKHNGNRYVSKDFIRLRLSNIFNKNIGSTQMRRIAITNKYKPRKDEMEEDARKMGTSTAVIRGHYIKE